MTSNTKKDELKPLKVRYKQNPEKELTQSSYNTPHDIAAINWVSKWSTSKAVLELLSNWMDESRKRACLYVSESKELEIKDEPDKITLHIGNVIVGEAVWGVKESRYITSYTDTGKVKATMTPDGHLDKPCQYIQLTNHAGILPMEGFTVGSSSKLTDQRSIGMHGEGLSGACVALCREGIQVTADCTHYSYTASVMKRRNRVCFQLKNKPKHNAQGPDTVVFDMVFDPRERAVDLQELMGSVRLSSAAAAAGVTTSRAIVLLDPALRGKIFCRGCYVATDPRYRFGYNFFDPDKDLLPGRDRHIDAIGLNREFGFIFPEVILQSEEVREEVLKCFLYGPNYDPNGPGGSAPKRYGDLKDGMSLTPAAIDALRRHYEQSRLAAGQRALFIAVDTPELKEIRRFLDLVPVFCLPVLHNNTMIDHDFQAMLVRDAQELDLATRVGALQDPLRELLQVRELKQLNSANVKIGIWVSNNVGYVTAAHSLGQAEAVGLSATQEDNIYDALQATRVGGKTIIAILRLLRKQPAPEPLPEPEPVHPPPPVLFEAALEEKQDEPEPEHALEEQNGELEEEEVLVNPLTVPFPLPASNVPLDAAGADAPSVGGTPVPRPQPALPPLEQLQVTPAAVAPTPLINDQGAQDDISMGESEGDAESGADDEEGEENEDSELESASCDEESGDSDDSYCGTDHSETPDSSEGPDVYLSDSAAEDLPAPKRQKRVRFGACCDPLPVSAAPQPLPQLILPELPQEIALSNSVVRQLRFYQPCGIWLYSDNADSEHAMLQLLDVCVPSDNYRTKLRTLSSLCHIVVFLTADEQAPLGINRGPHCMCINIGECSTEKLFRFTVDAQLSSLGMMK